MLIIDLAGATWSMARHVSLLQGNSKIAVDNYPELYAPVLIVNAPVWISSVWALFKPLIPAETRKKISIVSAAATLPTLLQHVHLEQIPAHLGGMRADEPGNLPSYPRVQPVPKAV